MKKPKRSSASRWSKDPIRHWEMGDTRTQVPREVWDSALVRPSSLDPASVTGTYVALEVVQPAADESGYESTFYRIGGADVIVGNVNSLGEERDVLRSAVKNLWRIYRYNQHYIGFLGGGLTEEDFSAAAEEYAVNPLPMSVETIRRAVEILGPLIHDPELTPKDLAMVLNTDPEQLELALPA